MAPSVTAGPRRPAQRGPTQRGPGQGRHTVADLVGLSPATALFGLFIIVPMLGAVVLSFFR